MATPPLLKRLNEETVLDTIRSGAPISRAEIARRAGISKPTVSLALQTLLEAGLVRQAAEGPPGPSYGALYFEPVAEAALVLGVDLGARFLRGAVSDLSGAVRARHDVELVGADAESALAAIVDLRDALAGAAGLAPELIDQAVVGVPGVVEERTGAVRLATNVPGLDGRRYGAELEERLGVRVRVENDVNLAALGEGRHGVARGAGAFVFLSIGTGLGAGLVLRGELQRGHHGAAGELDYALFRPLQVVTRRPGANQSRLRERSRMFPEARRIPVLPIQFDDARLDRVASQPLRRSRQHEEAAMYWRQLIDLPGCPREVVREEARRIALHIAPIAAVTDVGLVVLGGGIGANAQLLDDVRPLLAKWLPFPPRVEISSLGDGAVLMGALAVGVESALDRVFVSRRSPA